MTSGIDIYPPVATTPASSVPTGAVMDFAGLAAPSGWLICDGTAVSRTTYAALFAVLGTTYGSGDGVGTFNLPNANGRVTLGAGGGRSLAALLGTADAVVVSHDHGTHGHGSTGTVSADHAHSTGGQTAGHDHYMNINDRAAPQSGGLYVQGYSAPGRLTGGANQDHGHNTGGINTNHTHDVGAVGIPYSGVTGVDQNLPPALVLYKIIKV